MWHTGVHRCLRGNHNDRTPTPQSGNLIFATLLRSRAVKRVVEWLEAHEDEGPRGVRRRLLGTSVRLTRRMAGDLHEMVDACRERHGVQTPLELYVYASPSFNAACVKPEAGRLFILFSSSLIESFKGNELGFVIGHELGHHLYDHHDVPIGYLLRGREPAPPSLALQLFAWSRYAEISADRAGALCAGDLEAEARSLFMLSSGLTGATIEFRLDDFLTQVGEMQLETDDPGVGAPREDWFSTHPFSPLRVKALQLFSESEFVTEGGGSGAELEAQIQSLMALMEPSYLEEHSEAAEAMRRLLFAARSRWRTPPVGCPTRKSRSSSASSAQARSRATRSGPHRERARRAHRGCAQPSFPPQAHSSGARSVHRSEGGWLGRRRRAGSDRAHCEGARRADVAGRSDPERGGRARLRCGWSC